MKSRYFWTNSLVKVFPDQCPEEWEGIPKLTVFQGEVPAIQLVYYRTGEAVGCRRPAIEITFSGDRIPVRCRCVELVPSTFPAYDQADENYLTREPGLFPDLLVDLPKSGLPFPINQYRSLWIDIPNTEKIEPGTYSVSCSIKMAGVSPDSTVPKETREALGGELSFTLEVLPVKLPEQSLLHTEWFHADCLADYYRVPVFSEFHWDAIERQIALAAEELRVNVILTPVFTPPLDTAVGGERTTVQLVDVTFHRPAR